MGQLWDLISEDELAKFTLEIDIIKLIRRMLHDDNEEDMRSGATICSCCGQSYADDNFHFTEHPQIKTIYVVCSKCRKKLDREAEPDEAVNHMLLERMLEKLKNGTLGEVRDEEGGLRASPKGGITGDRQWN